MDIKVYVVVDYHDQKLVDICDTLEHAIESARQETRYGVSQEYLVPVEAGEREYGNPRRSWKLVNPHEYHGYEEYYTVYEWKL